MMRRTFGPPPYYLIQVRVSVVFLLLESLKRTGSSKTGWCALRNSVLDTQSSLMNGQALPNHDSLAHCVQLRLVGAEAQSSLRSLQAELHSRVSNSVKGHQNAAAGGVLGDSLAVDTSRHDALSTECVSADSGTTNTGENTQSTLFVAKFLNYYVIVLMHAIYKSQEFYSLNSPFENLPISSKCFSRIKKARQASATSFILVKGSPCKKSFTTAPSSAFIASLIADLYV